MKLKVMKELIGGRQIQTVWINYGQEVEIGMYNAFGLVSGN